MCTLMLFALFDQQPAHSLPAIISWTKNDGGVTLKTTGGTLRLQIWRSDVIRVQFSPTSVFSQSKSLTVIGTPEETRWHLSVSKDNVALVTSRMQAIVDRENGTVHFADADGNLLFDEQEGSRTFTPVTLAGAVPESAYQMALTFVLPSGQSVYGLGQHQQGNMNYQNQQVLLQQTNREVAIPFMVSNAGYGLLWDNPSSTTVTVEPDTSAVSSEDTSSAVSPTSTGASNVSWKSEAGDSIDYTVFFGPNLDHVIASYRDITGQAPMFAKWAFGFWQSKERYQNQQELLDIASQYRTRHDPIDNIVQDWFYWAPHLWGSHQFDQSRYPDFAGTVNTLHATYHLHVMISVWAKFAASTPTNDSANYDELNAKGFLYRPGLADDQFYDAFNPAARATYWRQLRDEIYSTGIDAWWLDASEPELDFNGWRSSMTGDGLAARVLNAYPLMHTTSVYEGQRTAEKARIGPDQRVFILTRSAYAGQQRNAAATWSGDITATWDVYAKQIPAGLNFCLSGIPYWTTDIGAFFDNYPDGNNNPAYRQLFTRWFQYGAFCPIFRVHGTGLSKEMWQFGPDTEKVLLKYDNLRYRLLPYIYSQAWQVTSSGSTMMRAMVMDFPADESVKNSVDEFMFGPSILVCPVTTEGAVSRTVTLPSGLAWTDFWTGGRIAGGQTITAPAPIDTMPLYVRSGSIIPMGPFLQYTGEKPADPIELRIYPGANGKFLLYEDDGITYDYEKGICATMLFTWNDAAKTLAIGACKGSFPGMLKHRTFHIVLVGIGHGSGLDICNSPDGNITYTGVPVTWVSPK